METTAFPEEFLRFLTENEVDIRVFQTVPSLRYFRLNPRDPASLPELESELRVLNPSAIVELRPLDWLPGFITVNAGVKIASTKAYKSGQIYGMDVSSAVPVDLLQISPFDDVLDLCCAPGAKLLYASDRLCGQGSITGVDINAARLTVCRNLIQKYGHQVRLFLEDGTSFDRMTEEGKMYGKVMVDAECTHEGSGKHLEKFGRQWGWETFKSRVLDTHVDLGKLQRGLARNGARLLRPGGYMTYSTCSYCRSQNEDIVTWLLATCEDLRLVDLTNSPYPARKSPLGLRFDPLTSNTGGQFVSLFHKLPQ